MLPLPETCLALFAAKNVGTYEPIEQNFETLLYNKLVNENHEWKTYAGGIISVTIQMSTKWAERIDHNVRDGNGKEKQLTYYLLQSPLQGM